jgi:hypothetical protein
VSLLPSVDVKSLCFIAVLSALVACSSNSGIETETDARPMAATGVPYGNCVEARKRAAAKPDLDVDRLASPRMRPAPFQRMPAAVKSQVNAKGMVAKVNVVVDTLGRADMKTFKVVEVSHSWLADNLKTVLPAWKFTPAELAGCKVRRVYKFSATKKARG